MFSIIAQPALPQAAGLPRMELSEKSIRKYYNNNVLPLVHSGLTLGDSSYTLE
jgi:hypothetical protein